MKTHLKGALADKHPIYALNFKRIGQVGESLVVEDDKGQMLVLTDAGMAEEPRRCHLLPLLPKEALAGQTLIVRFRLALDTRKLQVKPLSVVTDQAILRLTLTAASVGCLRRIRIWGQANLDGGHESLLLKLAGALSMSISILNQVYDEVRRSAIAGSAVAAGDFRLKKLIPALEKAGRNVPVFAKVAQAARQLIESDEQNSAALLELSTLINAILYPQGETGCDGPLNPIQTIDLGQQQTQSSAGCSVSGVSVLQSCLQASLPMVAGTQVVAWPRDKKRAGEGIRTLDLQLGKLALYH